MSRMTPTETLISSLEDIEDAEDVIIIRRRIVDGKDDIDWSANDAKLWRLLGMIEFVKMDLFKNASTTDE